MIRVRLTVTSVIIQFLDGFLPLSRHWRVRIVVALNALVLASFVPIHSVDTCKQVLYAAQTFPFGDQITRTFCHANASWPVCPCYTSLRKYNSLTSSVS